MDHKFEDALHDVTNLLSAAGGHQELNEKLENKFAENIKQI
jgi:hypothetical protein